MTVFSIEIYPAVWLHNERRYCADDVCSKADPWLKLWNISGKADTGKKNPHRSNSCVAGEKLFATVRELRVIIVEFRHVPWHVGPYSWRKQKEFCFNISLITVASIGSCTLKSVWVEAKIRQSRCFAICLLHKSLSQTSYKWKQCY